ncbi:P-loop containing nucleoside triphosphate hydrolase protein [Neocallimastix californiae]|uniref:Structural maintenance of chromosomes protein 5 n=1 Tax=Neocallimastix californiae TaxID=1754190 RepID=A0A1Y2FRG7_9FUNG|nr:P-loop containing nucleoside triphosphate hydrolase protein [Neocallimastix californiae]|eukprot:ORY85894.1 P-loop containing nucleoside triphosphate hydrolase protein [Neocallimastix californiae]
MEGKITKIVLKNFITYDYCEFNPGPGLNMIIGPNGSGKSSIVCGIGLGLGGSLQYLGRAKNISDYIKHGEDRAMIEISLSRKRGGRLSNVTIQRTFKRNDNKTNWKINGQSKTQKEVLSLIDSFNIQINNLCQFLPQEKVSEFAQMSSTELLNATLQAIGNNSLNKQYKELIENQEQRNALQTELKRNEDLLSKLKFQNDGIEKEVSRYKERETILRDVKVMEVLVPYVKYREKTNEWKELRKSVKDYKKNVEDLIDEMNKLIKDKDDKEKRIQEALKYKEDLDKEYYEYTKESNKISEELEKLEENNSLILMNFLQYKENKRKLNEEIKDQERIIDELKNKINDKKRLLIEQGVINENGVDIYNNNDNITTEIGNIQYKLGKEREKKLDIDTKMRSLYNDRNEIKHERNSLNEKIENLQNKKNNLDDMTKQRLNLLNHYNSHAYEANEWLKSHRSLFKMNVFSPVAIEINTNNKEEAAVVENTIGSSLYMFVTLCKEDYEVFTNELIDKKKLRISVVMFNNLKLSDFKAPIPKEELKKYGFDCYVLDLIQGPTEILNVLCKINKIHLIPYSKREINANTFDNNSILKKYIINDIEYTKNIRYNLLSIRTRKLKEANILSFNDSTAQKNEIEKEIQENEQKKRNVLKERRTEILNEKKEYNKLSTQYEIKLIEYNLSIMSRSSQLSTFDHEKEKFQNEYNENLKIRENLLTQYLKYKNKSLEKFNQKTNVVIKNMQDEINISNIENKIQVQRKKIKENKEECAKMEDKRNHVKQEAIKTYNEIELLKSSDQEILKLAIIKANEFDTLDEVNQKFADVKLNLEMISEISVSIVNDFEKREKEIMKLGAEIKRTKEKIINHDKKIKQNEKSFIPKIKDIINKLNEKFSESFEKIGCVGEIKLDEKSEYKNWGLNIYVKFRDTDNLQLLTGTRQSGGERSVSTILFLMSLQSFSGSPFRVVDEINQGMDSSNERLIHDQLIESASKEGTSQYFLVTPKLLPDLSYNSKMKVFCIFNGKWHNLEKHVNIKKIDFKSYINRKRKEKSEQNEDLQAHKRIHI